MAPPPPSKMSEFNTAGTTSSVRLNIDRTRSMVVKGFAQRRRSSVREDRHRPPKSIESRAPVGRNS